MILIISKALPNIFFSIHNPLSGCSSDLAQTVHSPIPHHSAWQDSRTRTTTSTRTKPCQAARSSEGRRYRKQPKMDALREYSQRSFEAHRHGLNVHRIAEVFRERDVDISKIHLMRAIRRFIEEEEMAGEELVKSEK